MHCLKNLYHFIQQSINAYYIIGSQSGQYHPLLVAVKDREGGGFEIKGGGRGQQDGIRIRRNMSKRFQDLLLFEIPDWLINLFLDINSEETGMAEEELQQNRSSVQSSCCSPNKETMKITECGDLQLCSELQPDVEKPISLHHVHPSP